MLNLCKKKRVLTDQLFEMLIYLNKKGDKKIYYYNDSEAGMVYGALIYHIYETLARTIDVPENIRKVIGRGVIPQKDIDNLLKWYKENHKYVLK